MKLRKKRRWELPESQVTSRSDWEKRPRSGLYTRRRMLAASGAGLALSSGCGLSVEGLELGQVDTADTPYSGWFPVERNEDYQVPERSLTNPISATTYNNYYEFSTNKTAVSQLVGDFEIEPWTIEVSGLCNNGGTFGVEDLFTLFDMEERIYRFRCVEAWAMTVPWSGFPLHRLLEYVDPTADATHVSFVSANDPVVMPGVDQRPSYPWPYHEGLRMDEAMNELTLMVGGLFGEPIPRQNGAPLRLIVPWKYGYKSIKSIVRIELTASQPETFWSTLVPDEYPFESNVDPSVPHPRWSQATERLIPGSEEVETLLYNGYEPEVGHLY
ncbi:MAG: protein-methionine-sulfoxide reductase catalytic subunit MsrP [Proteobacteria bacterium]|nr:protein-methionine-sulfoxide reductase catalytic subunit MsrP [Pseudomonadota bacterium]